MKNKSFSFFLLLVALLLLPAFAEAQCAMCKAVAETSQNGGSSAAAGLNSGILYLMAIPYLLLGAVGYALYRYKKTAPKKAL